MFGQIAKKAEKQSQVDLNRVIVPMLDMTFQILFFLIMSFRVLRVEGQLGLKLPEPSLGEIREAAGLFEPPEEYQLHLMVTGEHDHQSLIAGMTWKPKTTQQAETIKSIQPPNDERDEYARKLDPQLYGLFRKLKEVQPQEGGAQPIIKIESDGKLRYSELLRVMDVVRKMKFTDVGVMLNQK